VNVLSIDALPNSQSNKVNGLPETGCPFCSDTHAHNGLKINNKVGHIFAQIWREEVCRNFNATSKAMLQ